jgi:hypothetical protein
VLVIEKRAAPLPSRPEQNSCGKIGPSSWCRWPTDRGRGKARPYQGLKDAAKRVPTEGFKDAAKRVPTEGFKDAAKRVPTEGFKDAAKRVPTEGFKDAGKRVPTEGGVRNRPKGPLNFVGRAALLVR